KKQRSWGTKEFQEHGPYQWQSQSGICSAENVHDVRYEKSGGSKSTKKVVKDEDDDENADPAAIGQDAGKQDGNDKVFVKGKVKGKSPGSTCGKSSFNPLLSGHPKAKCSQKPKAVADQKHCALDGTATEERSKALGSNTGLGDRRKPVSPLLQLIHGSAHRQTHLKNRQDITFSADKNQLQYEDYDAKLRNLMANRDAIDRNVAKLMGPRQKESI
ncbi:hypothetical protein M5D96_013650, partial [Drosophila gunungcola]